MKNLFVLALILLFILSCSNRRQLYYMQEKARIEDSLRKVQAQKKADDDRDGVINYYDKCPETPPKARVDYKGCPMDVDLDGVIDLYDKCVTIPGTQENKGCPEE